MFGSVPDDKNGRDQIIAFRQHVKAFRAAAQHAADKVTAAHDAWQDPTAATAEACQAQEHALTFFGTTNEAAADWYWDRDDDDNGDFRSSPLGKFCRRLLTSQILDDLVFTTAHLAADGLTRASAFRKLLNKITDDSSPPSDNKICAAELRKRLSGLHMTAGDVMDGSGSALNTTAASPIRITIPGSIVAWQRARRRWLGDGRVISFTDRKVETYHGLVRTVAAQAMNGRPPITGAIEMTVIAGLPGPGFVVGKEAGSGARRHDREGVETRYRKPVRGAVDAMQSVVFNDDKQIVALYAQKIYGTVPCLEIELRRCDGHPQGVRLS